MADFGRKVTLLFVSCGSSESGTSAGQTALEVLKKEGVNSFFYASPLTLRDGRAGGEACMSSRSWRFRNSEAGRIRSDGSAALLRSGLN